jgi:DNA-binding transcriptional regulator GbsR (MarR family)
MSERDPVASAEFVEQFAAALTESGMPRMPARVLAVLIADDEGASTAAHLAEVLRASPAAISGAVRYLSQVRLVARHRRPGDRHDTWALHSDVWYEAIYNREGEVARWAALTRRGVEAVGPSSPAGRRMADTAAFFEFLEEEMGGLLERWRARRDG